MASRSRDELLRRNVEISPDLIFWGEIREA